MLDQAAFPTRAVGLLGAQTWLDRRISGVPALVAIEGTGSFDATLTKRRQAAGREVIWAARMPAGDLRGTNTSDELDAVQILGRQIAQNLHHMPCPAPEASCSATSPGTATTPGWPG